MERIRQRVFDFNGEGELLLVDKPLDWTSFDVVKKLRGVFRIAKAGHAGTLDPHATGLLIICTGKRRKNIEQFVGLEKEYVGSFELGIRTASHDTETEVIERKDYANVTLEQLRAAMDSFIGKQQQTPPMYSAVKVHGRPLYKYARKGKTVERAPKEIEVSQFDILSFVAPVVEFRVVCSKGTYIRTLVSDIGEKLGCGASMTSLRRTRIGSYDVADALTIKEFEALRDEHSAHQQILDEDCVPA
ncbi:MAG: tRNA pseudouridine(55) synthase TruB [Ignavibacteriales bacterium]|nr:tRNA pseudouridine(55) synthase TruB [Ignavibacteriales bacterium]